MRVFLSIVFLIIILVSQKRVNAQDCLSTLLLGVTTSNLTNAGSGSSHKVGLLVNGSFCETIMLEKPTNNSDFNSGNFFRYILNDFCPCECITVEDIEEIYMEENGNDGWNINTICVFLADKNNQTQLSKCNVDVNTWIDGDGEIDHIRYIMYTK